MEIRVLQYFLAVVREQSILKAAESLHLSQPTLSRQIRDMEAELGKQLFVRGSRKIVLTEEGMILRKRAEEILALVQKAEDEIAVNTDTVAGDVTIGAGETDGLRFLAKAAREIQIRYPSVRFHIHSGDDGDVLEELERGLIDFALLFSDFDHSRFDSLMLPDTDRFGVLMQRSAPLAAKTEIAPEDLWDQPLIVPRGFLQGNGSLMPLGKPLEELNIAASYSLLFNGSLMAAEGMGYVLGYDRIINVTGDSDLCFRPFAAAEPIPMRLVWKRYQIMTKPAEQFLSQVRDMIES